MSRRSSMSASEHQIGTIVDTCRTDELKGIAMEASQLDTPQDAATAVTLWFRTNEKGEWMMNHLEDGHCPNDLPTPKVPSQKSVWGKGTWTKEHAWLSGNLPPKVIHSPQNKVAREAVTGKTS